jgi:hypothetical protein
MEQSGGVLGFGQKILAAMGLDSRIWPEVACCSSNNAAEELREYVQTEDGMAAGSEKDSWKFENEDFFDTMSLFSARFDSVPAILPKMDRQVDHTPSQGSTSTMMPRTSDSNTSANFDDDDSTLTQSQSVQGLGSDCCAWQHDDGAPSFFPRLSAMEPPADLAAPADDTLPGDAYADDDDAKALQYHPAHPCSRLVRALSDATFYRPEQTLIIFDWDDTLCPSSACMESEYTDDDLAYFMHDLTLAAAALLQRAKQLAAKVVIVTNAGDGWVDSCCAAWMPELEATLKDVEICSARARWEPSGVSSPTGWKAKEFHNVINRFYSRYENQSWKNILAVGDAPYEHEALMRVVEMAPHCRSKSVRFITTPSIDQLTHQLRALQETLQKVVTHDGDLDIQVPVESLADVE